MGEDLLPTTSEVSRLIEAAGAGNQTAASELVALVYDELRSLARNLLRRERSDQCIEVSIRLQ